VRRTQATAPVGRKVDRRVAQKLERTWSVAHAVAPQQLDREEERLAGRLVLVKDVAAQQDQIDLPPHPSMSTAARAPCPARRHALGAAAPAPESLQTRGTSPRPARHRARGSPGGCPSLLAQSQTHHTCNSGVKRRVGARTHKDLERVGRRGGGRHGWGCHADSASFAPLEPWPRRHWCAWP
jgi:hypothetical protein